MTTQGLTSPTVPSRATDRLVLAGLIAASIGLLLAMMVTSPSTSSDPFESSLFRWSWLIVPAAAGVASFVRPRPVLWTAALIVPIVVAVALLGTVLHDPDEGASLWLIGEMFVLLLGAITFGGASIGAAQAWRRNRKSR